MGIAVSVIIPVYNMESYLEQCLNSVCSQTLENIEILCINDGSTDGSGEILEKYAKNDKRIVLFQQTNSGVAASRNLGIKCAQGECVIFMDPDDWYPENDILEVLYQKATEHHALVCGGEFSDYNHMTGEYGYEFPERYYGYKFEKEGFIDYRDYQFDFGYQRFLFQRKMLIDNQIFFPPLIRFQDPPFFVRAMITAERFYAIKKVTYCYRYGHRGNIWTDKKVDDLLDGLYMDLNFAIEKSLKRLEVLTVTRLNEEFMEIIRNSLKNGNKDILEKVHRIYCMVNDEQKEKIYKVQLEEILWLMIQENMELQNRKDELEIEILKLRRSKTFKIGQAFIFVPQKIYWWIKQKI